MISNELLKKKILDQTFSGNLIKSSFDNVCYKEISLVMKNYDSIRKPVSKTIRNNLNNRYNYYGATGKIDMIDDYIFDGNYLLIGEDGGNFYVDKDNCYVVNGKFWANNHVHVLSANNTVTNNYIKHYLNSLDFVKMGLITGTAIPKLNQKNLNSIKVPIISLNNQAKIVKKIEELFELIDKKEKNDKEKEKLKKLLKEKILDSAIRGELVENDLSLPAIDVEEIKEDIPFDIPTNWKWSKLENLGVITSSKRVFQNEWKNEGVPFYRARDIVSLNKGLSVSDLYISEEMYKEYSQKYGVPKKGDILLTGVGTIGESYVVKENDKFYFKDGNIIWLKKSCNVNSMYLKKYFESNFFKSQVYQSAKGATVLTLTIKHAKEILIPIPPLEQQKKIVKKIEKCFELIEQL